MNDSKDALVTRPDLDAIQARADAATPGPWLGWRDNNGVHTEILIGAKEPGPWSPEFIEAALCHICAVDGANDDAGLVLGWGNGVNRDNAEFIAHARENIPALLAALAAERERAERAEAVIEKVRLGRSEQPLYMPKGMVPLTYIVYDVDAVDKALESAAPTAGQ